MNLVISIRVFLKMIRNIFQVLRLILKTRSLLKERIASNFVQKSPFTDLKTFKRKWEAFIQNITRYNN